MSFFDIFQLAALTFFLVVFLGRTLVLWVRQGINPFALGAGKKGLHRLFELALFSWLILWLLAIMGSALHSPRCLISVIGTPFLLNSLPFQIAGCLLIGFGNFLFVWALISFRSSWRVGIDERKAGALVKGGAFAFSRNPIFVFLDLYFLGTFLINGTLAFLIFAGVTILGIHYQILQEERFLFSKYGQAYREYCSRTGRYVSLIPK
jgi:protein-S-isoprenylcysteine O-methyltransferase Ste14